MVPFCELRELWLFWRHANQILTLAPELECKPCTNPGGITLQNLSDIHVLYFLLILSDSLFTCLPSSFDVSIYSADIKQRTAVMFHCWALP